MKRTGMVLVLVILLLLISCTSKEAVPKVTYLIGVSQADMREPWRLVLTRELREEAAKHSNVRLVFTDATQDSEKQRKDIGRLLEYGIDLLIVSPCDADKITPVVSEVYQKIPVIVLDRVVEGYDYSLFIGPDNQLIGRQAGEAVVGMAGDKSCTVLELKGADGSQLGDTRSKGFRSVTAQHPNIQVLELTANAQSRDKAQDAVTAYGDKMDEIDIIFAHNDYMALGAYRGLGELEKQTLPIVGIDGFTGPEGGLDLIRKGIIDKTITCPTGGREAIQYALEILNEVSGVPKQVILRSHSITTGNVDSYERSLDKVPYPLGRTIRAGYVQVGTESGWRLANNQSIVSAARDFGIDLTVVDANQSHAKQIEAVEDFIKQKMDVIVLSPVIDSGWDTVLLEAREAGIPVLLSDRKIASSTDDLFLTFIGADFIEEGRRAMRWVVKNVATDKHPVRILEIQGTPGASPTIERKQGFEMILADYPAYSIIHSQSGNFTTEGGKGVVEEYLQQHGKDFDVIFAHNDDMALGAIQALEQAGINPGTDVRIISVDGTKEAVQALVDGKMNCVVECSPLLGPQLMKAITDLMAGKELPLRIITDEMVFTQENAKEMLKGRSY